MPGVNPPPHAVSEVCAGDTVLSQEPRGVIPPIFFKTNFARWFPRSMAHAVPSR